MTNKIDSDNTQNKCDSCKNICEPYHQLSRISYFLTRCDFGAYIPVYCTKNNTTVLIIRKEINKLQADVDTKSTDFNDNAELARNELKEKLSDKKLQEEIRKIVSGSSIEKHNLMIKRIHKIAGDIKSSFIKCDYSK